MKYLSLQMIALCAVLITGCVSDSMSDTSGTSTTAVSGTTSTSTSTTPEPTTQSSETETGNTTTPTTVTPTTPTEDPEPPAETEPTDPPETNEPIAAQPETLPWLRVPMHYGVLYGQYQIWNEQGGTVNLQVAAPAAAESNSLELASDINLLEQQLITYRGDNGEYYSAQIQSINNKTINLTTPLKQAVSVGGNAWNFYDNGSHPNTISYQAIADFAARQLDLNSLNNGVHVLLGDSWFDDGSFMQRMQFHLPLASFVNKGIGGNTSGDLLVRFDSDVASYTPNFVWVISGTNDYWQDVSAATYKANMSSLISKIKALNAVPIIIDSSVGPLNFGTDTLTQLSHTYVTALDQLYAESE